jgi:hypothetical protein
MSRATTPKVIWTRLPDRFVGRTSSPSTRFARRVLRWGSDCGRFTIERDPQYNSREPGLRGEFVYAYRLFFGDDLVDASALGTPFDTLGNAKARARKIREGLVEVLGYP